jgi:5-oxoprolinase (ATP-hydrolysing) subunit A
MALSVDLNADMGESYGRWTLGDDAALMGFLTSANIACGFHGGDPHVIRSTVALAVEHGVGVGAHVSFPDLIGFGRRRLAATAEEVQDYVVYQAGAIRAFVEAAGGRLQHVKPHGALYNMAVRDAPLADAVARAAFAIDPSLTLFAPSDSALAQASGRVGLRVTNEVFADRNYMPDGTLVHRSRPDALLHDPEAAVERVLRMLQENRVRAIDGSDVAIKAETICIHGDNPESVAFARELRAKLLGAGIAIAAPRA